MGEAKAAKRALENLCDTWGIDVAQLFDDNKQSREFCLPYNDILLEVFYFNVIAR